MIQPNRKTGRAWRLLGATSVAAMAVGVLPISAASAAVSDVCPAPGQTNPFIDVGDSVHEDNIHCAEGLDLVEGTTPVTYNPEGSLTRGQAASILVNYVEVSTGDELVVDGTAEFTDVAGTTHEENIDKAVDNGILNGYPDGTFRPGADITREQFATIAVQATEYILGGDLVADNIDTFDDDDTSVHELNIERGSDNDLFDGTGPRAFSPRNRITRGQAATIIIRAIGNVLVPEGAFQPVESGLLAEEAIAAADAALDAAADALLAVVDVPTAEAAVTAAEDAVDAAAAAVAAAEASGVQELIDAAEALATEAATALAEAEDALADAELVAAAETAIDAAQAALTAAADALGDVVDVPTGELAVTAAEAAVAAADAAETAAAAAGDAGLIAVAAALATDAADALVAAEDALAAEQPPADALTATGTVVDADADGTLEDGDRFTITFNEAVDPTGIGTNATTLTIADADGTTGTVRCTSACTLNATGTVLDVPNGGFITGNGGTEPLFQGDLTVTATTGIVALDDGVAVVTPFAITVTTPTPAPSA